MFKKLQRLVPREVKEALHDAKAALGGSTESSSGGPRVAVGVLPTASTQIDEDPDGIFEIGEDDCLAPLFEPFSDEVSLFDATLPCSPSGACSAAAAQTTEASSETAFMSGAFSCTMDGANSGAVGSSTQLEFDREKVGHGPVAAILVVDFHHLQGPTVEWAYPVPASECSPPSSPANSPDEAFPSLDSWAVLAEAPSREDLLRAYSRATALALPDAAHREKPNGTACVFFVVNCGGALLYGVSCHRRVTTSDLVHRDANVSRSVVQKAVCVLSRCPFYGMIQQRLSPVTQAFFEQKDFRCTTLLRDFYMQLNALPLEKLPESDLFHDLDHAPLFRALKHQLLSVLKAVLLEAKVLVYSESAEACSRAVLCLLSLLPGGLWLGFNSNGLGGRHFRFQKYGLPFQIFGSRCCVYPYMGVQMLDKLLQMRGFLVGTTNRVVAERASPDIVLEVPADISAIGPWVLQIRTKDTARLTKSTKADRRWLREALAQIEAIVQPTSNLGHTQVPAATEDVDEDDTADDEEEESDISDLSKALRGADVASNTQPSAADLDRRFPSVASGEPLDWLIGRASPQWLAAPQLALRSADPGKEPVPEQHSSSLLQEASWAAVVDANRATFWAHWERLLARVAHAAGLERDLVRGVEVAPREVRSELSQFGLEFLQRWVVHTQGGRKWIQAHKLPVSDRRPKPPREGQGVYRFANGDEYHGEFRRGVRHGVGVYIGAKKRIHYDGQWRHDQRSGSGTLTVEGPDGQVLYTYDGEWVSDQRHGRGSCVQRGREKYAGQWSRNLYHGAGTSVDAAGVLYEGEWAEGRFHGVGKHNASDESYTGEFRDGQRHGMGQLARDETNQVQDGPFQALLGCESLFAGQWFQGKRSGHGRTICKHGEFEGDWMEGVPHGQGVLLHNGHQLDGPWLAGELDESGTYLLFYPCGAKYTGRIKRRPGEALAAGAEAAPGPPPHLGSASAAPAPQPTPGPLWWVVPEGHGLMKMPDGQIFEGEHRAGLAHGRGLSVGADRSRYEGEFAFGERHGKGQLTLPGAEPESVYYEAGELRSAPSSEKIGPSCAVPVEAPTAVHEQVLAADAEPSQAIHAMQGGASDAQNGAVGGGSKGQSSGDVGELVDALWADVLGDDTSH